MLETEIKHIKASDVLLPQTDLQGFIAKQTPSSTAFNLICLVM